MITEAQRDVWDRDGFVFLRGAVDPALAATVEAEAIGRIRADPPAAHPGQQALMEPGDVLFFHNYLMHMSTDNAAADRRSAMVCHYGRAGTQALTPDSAARLARVNRWVPIRRAA